jgi:hypothetical protein
MWPVAQGLPIHPAGLRRFHPAPPVGHEGQRLPTTRRPGILRSRRFAPKVSR